MTKIFLTLFVLLFGTQTVQLWAAATKSGFDEKAVGDFYRGKTVRVIVGFRRRRVRRLFAGNRPSSPQTHSR